MPNLKLFSQDVSEIWSSQEKDGWTDGQPETFCLWSPELRLKENKCCRNVVSGVFNQDPSCRLIETGWGGRNSLFPQQVELISSFEVPSWTLEKTAGVRCDHWWWETFKAYRSLMNYFRTEVMKNQVETEGTDTQFCRSTQLVSFTWSIHFQQLNQLLSLSERRSASPESFTVPSVSHSDHHNKPWLQGHCAAHKDKTRDNVTCSEFKKVAHKSKAQMWRANRMI